MGILSIAFEFQFHGAFQNKKIALRGHPKFFIANFKKEGMKSEISLSEE